MLSNPFLGSATERRRGVGVLLVLAVLGITLGLVYAVARSSATVTTQAAHEQSSAKAGTAVESSVNPTLNNLRSNPNWMPRQSPSRGRLQSKERYQVDLQILDDGAGRSLAATAEVVDLQKNRPVADEHLKILLAKQARNDLPTAAIAAFWTASNRPRSPSVYVASGNTIRGNVRSRGPIHFQNGFVLAGKAYRMDNISTAGTTTSQYLSYRAAWGTVYQAGVLSDYGKSESNGRVYLEDVALGPCESNPMGVFYHRGPEVVLGNNVVVNGTLAVTGNLTLSGSGIHLVAVQLATNPTKDVPDDGPGRDSSGSSGKGGGKDEDKKPDKDHGKGHGDEPVARNDQTRQTTFPAVVADGSITVGETADVVRASGLLLARQNFRRVQGKSKTLSCGHDHSLAVDEIKDIFNSSDGPAIYLRGAVMANRVLLENRKERPLALVFDSSVVQVTDAPGFFTWRVSEWTEAE